MKCVRRRTNETDVEISLALEGDEISVHTSDAFLDHMLGTLARYAGVSLHVQSSGDLKHHLVEDVAITLGAIVWEVTPSQCARYGHSDVVMDEAWVRSAIDLGGRFYYEGSLPFGIYEHFMRSFAEHSKMTAHMEVFRGKDKHHIVEACFKSLGLCLRDAWRKTDRVFSTKGSVEWSWEDREC